MIRSYAALATGLILAGLPHLAAAQAPSAAEMAEKLANPTSAVASLTNNFNFTEFDGDLPGANDQRGWNYLFQPVFPFPQANGRNILFRPAISLLAKQPVFDPGTGQFSDEFELGDLAFDLAYGGTNPDTGLLLLGGMVGSIPTATSDAVGSDQWALGPEFAIGLVRKWGVFGLLVNHQWDVAGDDDRDTNVTGGQYFYAFPFGDGTWQVAAGPSWSYNHELSGERWTLPLGIGLAKTAKIGERIWKFSLQYWNYVEAPDAFGPEHLLRFTVAPVVELPWGKSPASVAAAGSGGAEWVPLSSATEVRALYTNTVAIGDNWTGEYCGDGSGTVSGYGDRFQRRWEVKGAQGCVTGERGTACYSFERSAREANRFRARNLATGELRIFVITGLRPESCGTTP